MNWKIKAFIQRAFDKIPGGDHLNYLAQRHITKGLPVSLDVLKEKIGIASLHFNSYKKYADDPSETPHFLEFGAGWDLIIPLTHYCLGIEQQTLVDVKPHLKEDLILNTALRLTQFCESQKGPLRAPEKMPENGISLEKKMEKHWGICYKAPLLMQRSGLATGSVDCITSTSVLEHVPEKELLPILKESYRVLKNGGIMSCIIDYKDHYAYFDPGISVYNFLQYSDDQWKKYNHYQQYQSRLRHKDYIQMIENQTNFEILQITPTLPSEPDLQALRKLKVADQFRNYPEEELSVQLAHIILKKK